MKRLDRVQDEQTDHNDSSYEKIYVRMPISLKKKLLEKKQQRIGNVPLTQLIVELLNEAV